MLTEAIYTILSGDATLTASLATTTSIYNTQAPKEAADPCVVYAIDGQAPVYTKDGSAPVIFTTIEVDIFAKGTPKTAWTIEGYVKSALDQYSGTTDGVTIDLIQWEGSDDGVYDVDRDEYQVSMGFRIRLK